MSTPGDEVRLLIRQPDGTIVPATSEHFQGPPGPPGRSIRVEFAVPSATWHISYETDVPPSVTIVAGGEVLDVFTRIDEPAHEIIVEFGAPTSGVAFLYD